MISSARHTLLIAVLTSLAVSSPAALAGTAYLEIANNVDSKDRAAAVDIYRQYKQRVLSECPGAKWMSIRRHDVQVLYGFATTEQAETYLSSDLFNKEVVVALKPILKAEPEARIYSAP